MSEISRAYFIRTADEGGGAGGGNGELPANAVAVQFNPTSLQYGEQINNQQQGANPQSVQYVAQAEATLEMELLFDTTPSGTDVRRKSQPIRRLSASRDPHEESSTASAANRAPPRVAFVWGIFRFVGVVSGFRETLDFFSSEGVPVRSSVRVSMKSTDTSEVRVGPRNEGPGSSMSFGGDQDNAPGGTGTGAGVGLGLSAGIGIGGVSATLSARLAPGFADAAQGRAFGAALGSESLRLPMVAGALSLRAGPAQTAPAAGMAVQPTAAIGVTAGFGFGGQATETDGGGVRSTLSGGLRFTSAGA